MERKYELTAETLSVNGRTLHRIKALRDFSNVKAGELGGWTEKESNLSHSGNCWVYNDAKVYDNAEVWGNADVYDNAKVWGDAKVCDNADVYGNAKVYGNAEVCGNAKVYGNAEVYGDANIKSMKDYIVFKNWWSSGRYFTWTRSNNKWRVGCFHGTGEKLVAKAYEDSEESGKHYAEIVDYVNRCVLGKNTGSNESQNQRPRD